MNFIHDTQRRLIQRPNGINRNSAEAKQQNREKTVMPKALAPKPSLPVKDNAGR